VSKKLYSRKKHWLTNTHTLTPTNTFKHSHSHSHLQTHSNTHTLTPTNTFKHSHSHLQTHSNTHTLTPTNTFKHSHSHTDKHTQTLTLKHSHSHTHKHTRLCFYFTLLFNKNSNLISHFLDVHNSSLHTSALDLVQGFYLSFSSLSQFHQHFTHAFLVQNFGLRTRFLYKILAPKIAKLCFGFDIFRCQNIGAQNAHIKCWLNWHLLYLQSSSILLFLLAHYFLHLHCI